MNGILQSFPLPPMGIAIATYQRQANTRVVWFNGVEILSFNFSHDDSFIILLEIGRNLQFWDKLVVASYSVQFP